jgi:hypothetical protein
MRDQMHVLCQPETGRIALFENSTVPNDPRRSIDLDLLLVRAPVSRLLIHLLESQRVGTYRPGQVAHPLTQL